MCPRLVLVAPTTNALMTADLSGKWRRKDVLLILAAVLFASNAWPRGSSTEAATPFIGNWYKYSEVDQQGKLCKQATILEIQAKGNGVSVSETEWQSCTGLSKTKRKIKKVAIAHGHLTFVQVSSGDERTGWDVTKVGTNLVGTGKAEGRKQVPRDSHDAVETYTADSRQVSEFLAQLPQSQPATQCVAFQMDRMATWFIVNKCNSPVIVTWCSRGGDFDCGKPKSYLNGAITGYANNRVSIPPFDRTPIGTKLDTGSEWISFACTQVSPFDMAILVSINPTQGTCPREKP